MQNLLKDKHFEWLGVTRTSTKEEIKKAYRTLIKKWHPDKFHDRPEEIVLAVEKSKQLNEAYSLLANYNPSSSTNNPSSKTRSGRVDVELTIVKSSSIFAIGYHLKERILQVKFIHGGVYQYYDVPMNIHEEFMAAVSKGKYLNRNIVLKYFFDKVQ